ncbi:hypothetical protein JCM3774_001186 [Rhodotorula dairenensis]
MALLRSGAALLARASSLEMSATLAARTGLRAAPYSTESTSQPSVHEVQALPRKRELRKVAEGSGSTAQLIGLAVKNTSERAGKVPGQGQEQGQRGGQRAAGQGGKGAPGAGQRAGGVAPGKHREELQRLLAERKAAAARGQTEGAFASGPSGSGMRPGGGPRRAAGGPGGARPRPPRAGAAPGGPPGAPNSGPPRPRKPASPRRPPRSASTGPREASRWSADELKPLVPPAHVSLSRANLAGLVKASALYETSQLRLALQEVGVSVDAKEKTERDQARKVLAGDYSPWLATASSAPQASGSTKGGEKKSNEVKGPGPVEQARAILSLNAAIPLKSREQVLDKIREATV